MTDLFPTADPRTPVERYRLPNRWKAAAAAAVLLAGGLIAGTYVRLPLYAIQPGPARDVVGLVTIRGERTFPVRGSLLLTTVSVSTQPISLFEGMAAWFDPATELVPRAAIIPPGVNDEEQDQINLAAMLQSKYAAAVVALRSIGRPVQPVAGGRVVYVFKDSPSEGKLREGDVITRIDGLKAANLEALTKGIRDRRPGENVNVEVLRGGQTLTFTMRTKAAPGSGAKPVPIIGVSLAQAFRLGVDIQIDTQDIGGPSGGLVFALTIVDVMTPGDLTRGLTVAATGTIDISGRVGEIGGIEQKVRAAERSGADVFLVPASEADDAAKVASSVKVLGVRTLDEAISALGGLSEVRTA